MRGRQRGRLPAQEPDLGHSAEAGRRRHGSHDPFVRSGSSQHRPPCGHQTIAVARSGFRAVMVEACWDFWRTIHWIIDSNAPDHETKRVQATEMISHILKGAIAFALLACVTSQVPGQETGKNGVARATLAQNGDTADPFDPVNR